MKVVHDKYSKNSDLLVRIPSPLERGRAWVADAHSRSPL